MDCWYRLKGPVLRSTALVGFLALSVHLMTGQERTAEGLVPNQRPEPPRTESTYRPETADTAEELLTVQTLKQRPPYLVHTIQPGETLGQIARQYHTLPSLLEQLNPGALRRPLPAGGTLLVVPNPDTLVYETALGDTIEGVAARYEIAVQDVTRLSEVGVLQIGERLLLRGAKPLAERPRVEVASRKADVRRAPASAVSAATPTPAPAPAPTPAAPPPVARTSSPGWIWPVQVPILEFTEFDANPGEIHLGLDMAAAAGTPVVAARSGTVISAGWHDGYGWNVIVDHGDGIQTRYAHGSKLYVAKGDWVEQGQVLLPMGSTGRSTGPHLHFEVMVSGHVVDPRAYLP
ncbi:MAG TPA: LysM peptidoglycan-binding domain-containing M23 family metallopeptidase [Symbiobacteriaceae bacterium]|nr:LysM peptidoglycan-binding domain-containing M23 family metallopeptidase [Symbiobacteriaceae bacterium]